ncbi:MAG: hypothetical protein EBZ48_15480 [Proteobacteria bacterium]|nr:hypothetical protein [Pseudomonadota bacterium]
MWCNKSLFVAVVGVALLSGCGPMYNTSYSYTPPRSPEGRACTFQCNQIQIQCQQLEDMNRSRCQQDAQREQRECEWNIRITEGRKPKWYECGGDSCSVDYARCEQTYRACYQSCGGTVTAETRCVANCDKIPVAERR